MKKILFLILTLSSLQHSSKAFFLSENEYPQFLLNRTYYSIPRNELFNEKIVNESIEKIKKECLLQSIDFEQVLQQAVVLVDRKIEYYETLHSQSRTHWTEPCKWLGLSLACTLLIYYIHTMDKYFERRALDISRTLDRLDPDVPYIEARGSRAILIPSADRRRSELYSELISCTRTKSFGDDFMLFGVLSLGALNWGIKGINDILDQKYSGFYKRKYTLIKDRFCLLLDELK